MCFQSWSVAVQLKTTDKQQQRLTVKVAGMFASQLIYIYTHTHKSESPDILQSTH